LQIIERFGRNSGPPRRWGEPTRLRINVQLFAQIGLQILPQKAAS
jgi:hypothetical protein